MIDVKKTRNNFQKFPSLKQKCDPAIVVKPQTTSTIRNSHTTPTSTVTGTSIAATTATVTKSINSSSSTTASPSKSSSSKTSSTDSNPVREANQHFFLVQEFKDQNFLKAECELAQAQVYKKPSSAESALKNKIILPSVIDNRNSINKFSNRFSTTNNNNNLVSIFGGY